MAVGSLSPSSSRRCVERSFHGHLVWDSRAVLGLWFECAWKPGEGDDWLIKFDQIWTYFNQPIISSLVWGMEQPKSSFWVATKQRQNSLLAEASRAKFQCLLLKHAYRWWVEWHESYPHPHWSFIFWRFKCKLLVIIITIPVSETLPGMCSFPIAMGMKNPKWHQVTNLYFKGSKKKAPQQESICHQGRHRSQPKSCRWPDKAIPHGKMRLWGRIQPLWRRNPRVAVGNLATTSPFWWDWWVYGSCYSLLLRFYHD